MADDTGTEKHFTAPQLLHDIAIGLSDGLTVPFAIAAGLSTTASATIVLIGGVSEIIGGMISMGLGGYLAARTDNDHYTAERQREKREIREKPKEEDHEIIDIFHNYGLTQDQIRPILQAFHDDHEKWVDFMMRYELDLQKPDEQQARNSGLTIGIAYGVGGLVPLLPYVFLSNIQTALLVSAVGTLIVMFIFGYAKSRLIGVDAISEGVRTMVIGGVAAGAAYLIAGLL